jgi:hypothetical protein
VGPDVELVLVVLAAAALSPLAACFAGGLTACVTSGPAVRRDAHEGATGPEVVRVEDLRVECGSIGGTKDLLAIRSACTRFVVGQEPRSGTSLVFAFLGPTRAEEPLASGELRRQIGVKLRARDTCNVVYVMWHIAPTSGVFVSVKSNPGMTEHTQCGDGGYINLPTPPGNPPVPLLSPGGRHTLEARIDGTRLHVVADGVPAWDGALPPEAFSFDGPVGLRSDNAEFDLEMRTTP